MRSPTSRAPATSRATTCVTGSASPTTASASMPTPCCLAPTPSEPHRAIRLATPDSLDALLVRNAVRCPTSAAVSRCGMPKLYERTIVTERQAIEETYFLGLRMNRGLELLAIKEEFGIAAVDDYRERHRRPGLPRPAGRSKTAGCASPRKAACSPTRSSPPFCATDDAEHRWPTCCLPLAECGVRQLDTAGGVCAAAL